MIAGIEIALIDKIYLALPKNASNSVPHSLRLKYGRCMGKMVTGEETNLVALVRHPEHRLGSAYNYFTKVNQGYLGRQKGLGLPLTVGSWERFVVDCCSIPDEERNQHIQSQSRLLNWSKTVKLIPWDFEMLAAELGLEEIVHQNRSPGSLPGVSAFTRAQIQKGYADDYELWQRALEHREAA